MKKLMQVVFLGAATLLFAGTASANIYFLGDYVKGGTITLGSEVFDGFTYTGPATDLGNFLIKGSTVGDTYFLDFSLVGRANFTEGDWKIGYFVGSTTGAPLLNGFGQSLIRYVDQGGSISVTENVFKSANEQNLLGTSVLSNGQPSDFVGFSPNLTKIWVETEIKVSGLPGVSDLQQSFRNPPDAPDGGATLLLSGIALTALAGMRRFLKA